MLDISINKHFFFFFENIYTNKKVSKSNNHNFENVITALFCFQNDLNANSAESWFKEKLSLDTVISILDC